MDYTEQVWMEILRPGNWNGFEITVDILKEIAAAYDPMVLRAPLVVDHQQSGPAYGHVLELQVRDEPHDKGDYSLWGFVGLLPAAVMMIASGAYNERSVYIRDDYPYAGINYLNHISLLGAANPAVIGMGPVILYPEQPAADEPDKVPDNMPFKIPEPGEGVPAYAEIAACMMNARRFIWDQTDEYVRYRVRPPSRFRQNSFRTVDLSADKGIKSVMGKLKPQYVPEGTKPDSMVIQAILFDRAKWDLARAKEWVAKNKDRLTVIETEAGIKLRKEGQIMDPDPEKEAGLKAVADENKTLKEQLAARDAEIARIATESDHAQIGARVDTMVAAGQLLPAHREMKIADAIAAIPKDAKVGDKSARDVIFAAFEHGMAPVTSLKKSVDANGAGSSGNSDAGDSDIGQDADIKRLTSSKAKVDPRSVKVAERARELRRKDKLDAGAALTRAEAEIPRS